MKNTSRMSAAEQLIHYLARERNYHARAPSIRARFPDVESPGFQRFIDVDAVLHLREIQEVAPPFPYSPEMLTVGGETDLRRFLSIGHECFESVRRHLPAAKGPRRILDFGIGCGRTMRHFFRDQALFECHGCDVDEAAVRWVQDNLTFVTAAVSSNNPPLIYRERFFDIVYCISVFTHLSRAAFDAWMAEIHRVLQGSGVFVTSMHGQTAFRQIDEQPDRRRLIGIDEAEFRARRDDFHKQGYLWLKQPAGSTDIDTAQYGVAFVPDDRFEDLVSRYFTVESYHPGEIEGWQDMAVLRPRK